MTPSDKVCIRYPDASHECFFPAICLLGLAKSVSTKFKQRYGGKPRIPMEVANTNRAQTLVGLSPTDLDPEGTGWQPSKAPEPARNGCVPRPGAAREWALVCAPPRRPSSCSGATAQICPTVSLPGLGLRSQVIDTVASANHFWANTRGLELHSASRPIVQAATSSKSSDTQRTCSVQCEILSYSYSMPQRLAVAPALFGRSSQCH